MSTAHYRPILRDALVLLVVHGIGVLTMTQVRLLDCLLSPSPESSLPSIGLGMILILIRVFVILFFPGWVMARLFLAATAETVPPEHHDSVVRYDR